MPPVTPDPTLLLDLAKAKTTEDKFELVIHHLAKVSFDVHTLKGNLAANTSLTKDMLEGQDQLASLIKRLDVEKIIELITAVDNMKGGVRVLGWLERPAKWIAAIGAAAAVIYSLWSQK